MTVNKWNWRKIAFVAGTLVLIWLIVGVVLAGREPVPPTPGMQPLTLHGGRVTGNRMSTKSWMFEYTKAEMSSDGTLASVDGIRQGVLYKKGKPYLSVTAEHVSVNTQTFDFTAVGDVHVKQMQDTGGADRSFDTDFIQWVNGSKMLMLPHPSIVRSGGQTLKVTSIKVNFNTGEIRFGGMQGGVGP
jgi:hypothetical protein